jgi:glycine/D-amino acid oxidase-like deaminating enzyme
VVVGAGYTGLRAALSLARRGKPVLVLDRDAPGGGASGRNGGMVHPGGPHDLATMLAEEDGRGRWQETVQAFEAVEQLIDELQADVGWQCCGHLQLAGHRRHLPQLRRAAEAHRSLGERARVVEGKELTAEIGSSAFAGGLVVERSGALQPAALAAALAQAAIAAGADVRAGIDVRRIRANQGPIGGIEQGLTVSTSAGDVRAGQLLVATGAASGRLLPDVGRRLLAVGSFMIATEAVAADVAHSISPRRRMFFDTRNFLNYWRLSPDATRVLFGGRASFAPTTSERARDRLYAQMVRIHPQLRGVRVDRAWSGTVDLSLDREPHVGRDPRSGAWYAAGYSGTGVALSLHLGDTVARWMCGEHRPHAFADDRRR